MENLTISQILAQYKGFDKAFWATYSIDFDTIDFLLKKDFKNIMNPYYIHLICDTNKLDEAIEKLYEDNKDYYLLTKLQEFCTISHQVAKGAFHPKILLLCSEKEILAIISSANATPSGILSNQDLITCFYWEQEKKENQAEITSIFNYIKNFNGWCKEAHEDFNVVQERFDFINKEIPSNNILTAPNDINLLNQIHKQLIDKDKIKEIRIFSPFFDDELKAISEIEGRFKKKIKVFCPQKEIETSLTNKLPNSVVFYSTDKMAIKSFHAKFYEFNYGDSSIVFWGSANCSYSALLSTDRNYEILIKNNFEKTELLKLWGELDNVQVQQVTYGTAKKDTNTENEKNKVTILSISEDNKVFVIQLDRMVPFIDGIVVKAINSKNQIASMNKKSVNEDTIVIDYSEDIIIVYLEKDGEKISNFVYINNVYALDRRIRGQSEDSNHDVIKADDRNAINFVFGLFNIDPNKRNVDHIGRTENKKGFWRLPKFSTGYRSTSILNLEDFITSRTIRFKNRKDEENTGEQPEGKSTPRKRSLNQKILRESGKLLNNISQIVEKKEKNLIPRERWLKGLAIIIHYTLHELDQNDRVEVDYDLTAFFSNLARIGTWMILNLVEDRVEYNQQIELLDCILDLNLALCIYQYEENKIFYINDSLNPDIKESLTDVKRARFFKHLIYNSKLANNQYNEHNKLTLEDFLNKLSNLRISKKINLNKIEQTTGFTVYSNQLESFLLLDNIESKKIRLETLLGEEKMFSINAPLNKTSYN